MSPLRIGLIHISQETNDFNPRPTTLEDFVSLGLHEGPDVIARAGATSRVAGHLRAVAGSGLAVETVPIICAHAVAGGRIDRAAHAFFLDRIRSGLAAAEIRLRLHHRMPPRSGGPHLGEEALDLAAQGLGATA